MIHNFVLHGTNVIAVYLAPYAIGSDLYRIIFEIRALSPESKSNKLIKRYEVWVIKDVVEDSFHLGVEASDKDILNYAQHFLERRYKDSGNQVPNEDGAFVKSQTEIRLGNPNTFSYKLPQSEKKPKKIMTTVMLPEDAIEWLKEYSSQRNISTGEAIRQAVMDLHAGTARTDKGQTMFDSSGAAVPKND